MAILSQLGINYTTFYCFLIFVVTFFFLKELLFRPYYLAFEEREKRTKGGQEGAKDLQKQTLDLHKEFEQEARDLNSQIKNIFDLARSEATKDVEGILASGRKSAEKVIEETRLTVAGEVKKSREQMRLEAPSIALAITKKMLD